MSWILVLFTHHYPSSEAGCRSSQNGIEIDFTNGERAWLWKQGHCKLKSRYPTSNFFLILFCLFLKRATLLIYLIIYKMTFMTWKLATELMNCPEECLQRFSYQLIFVCAHAKISFVTDMRAVVIYFLHPWPLSHFRGNMPWCIKAGFVGTPSLLWGILVHLTHNSVTLAPRLLNTRLLLSLHSKGQRSLLHFLSLTGPFRCLIAVHLENSFL